MKILVTGVTGFVGNHAIRQLLEADRDIRVIATSRNAENSKICKWFFQAQYVPCYLINYSINKGEKS